MTDADLASQAIRQQCYMAMNTLSSAWYVQGEGNSPLGPFTYEQLMDSWRNRRVDPNTLCWQEGMTNWLPLATVEPFTSLMRAERRSLRRKRLRRVAVVLLLAVVLVAIAGVAYFWRTESATLVRAKQLIVADRFDEASTLLEPIAKQSCFFRRRANYLLAFGLVRQFASASYDEDATDDMLVDARGRLGGLFAASPKWQREARTDLARVLDIVPSRTSGSLDRSLRLAKFLSQMQLADRKQLVKQLLAKAKDIWGNPERGPEQSHGELVAWIVSDDTSLIDEILTAVISDTSNVETCLDKRLACVQHWSQSKPVMTPLLVSGLVKRADRVVGTAAVETRHRVIVATKCLDSQFDTWRYWERHYQDDGCDNAHDAVAMLTFMVEGEQKAERLKVATDRYADLRKRYPGTEMTPPPEIRDAADAAHLHEMIAKAEQQVQNKQYPDARMTLDAARRRFSTVWNRDADAVRLDTVVGFHLHFENAQKSYGNGDLATALTEVGSALEVRPEDKETLELRRRIRVAVDKAEVEQHRRRAESAIAEGNIRVAGGEILKAREILERPSNAEWRSSNDVGVDEVGETLLKKVREQATDLSTKRQYRDAEAAVAMGLRLYPKDKGLSELTETIKTLKTDPKSANISGIWQCNDDGNAIQMTLRDTGGDSVAWSLSESRAGLPDTGNFARKGAFLVNTQSCAVRGVAGEWTWKVRIEAPDKLVGYSSAFTPEGRKQAALRDKKEYTWKRVKDETNALEPDEETEASGSRASNRQPSSRDAGERRTPPSPSAPLPIPPRRR